MKNKLPCSILCVALTLSMACGAYAQRNVYKGTIEFSEPEAVRAGGMLSITIKTDLSNLTLQRQQMVVLTPTLSKDEGGNSYTYIFPSVVIAGNARYKALARQLRFGNKTFENEPTEIIRRHNKTLQYTEMQMSVPFEEWMRGADLVFTEEVSGCAECSIANAEYIMKDLLPPPFVPLYLTVLETPEIEPVKTRSETHSATINFVVNRYELIRNYKNNAQVLDQTDMIVKEVLNDPNLEFTSLRVDGYASPEGNYNSNMKLSENRAMSFVGYLREMHGIPASRIMSYGHGEDWEGLRKEVASSNMPAREQILDVIDGNSDITVRKQKLRELNAGTTYRYLLDNLYPPLRRNDYTFTYIVRPFSVEEAKDIIKTRPGLLSLNEMYLVAGTYPEGSPEYDEAFRTALKYFPNDSLAATNLGAVEIEAGNIEAAISLLVKLDTPAAYNNLGVAYTRQGSPEIAEEYFRRGVAAGSEQARQNLEQLLRWKADQ